MLCHIVQLTKFLSSPILEVGNLQKLAQVGLVQKARSVVPRFKVCDSLNVLLSRPSKTLDDVLGCAILESAPRVRNIY